MIYGKFYKSFGLLNGQSCPQDISLFLNLIAFSGYFKIDRFRTVDFYFIQQTIIFKINIVLIRKYLLKN